MTGIPASDGLVWTISVTGLRCIQHVIKYIPHIYSNTVITVLRIALLKYNIVNVIFLDVNDNYFNII